MKYTKDIIGIMLTGVLLCSCNGKKEYNMWDKAPVVATKVMVRGDEMVSLDLSLLKDTAIFPLSHFMEEFEIVKLSDEEDALVYPAETEVSDNYILVKSARNPHGEYRASIPIPCKLFDKKGNFISNIGNIGQGPGEYTMIYSMQINEKDERIYLMPWQTNYILVYDLSGKPQAPIPLPYRTPKGVFKVEGDKVCVAITPFQNNPSVAWIQTVGGEVLHEIPASHFTVQDFSNEIFLKQNTEAIDISFWNWPARIDSLYHIDIPTGKLIPRFTANFTKKGNEVENHSYIEWPRYFIGNTSNYVHVSYGDESWTEGKKPVYYIVDKKTLKGSFLRIEDDYTDGKSIEYPIYLFNKGYHVRNQEPMVLLEWIENMLKSDVLPDKTRNKLAKLKDTIDENDNNYILYAKMKK